MSLATFTLSHVAFGRIGLGRTGYGLLRLRAEKLGLPRVVSVELRLTADILRIVGSCRLGYGSET